MDFKKYNKSYVPVAVAVILFGLSALHVTGQMSVSDGVTAIITSLGVYLIPNKA